MDKLITLFRDYPSQISALVALCALIASLFVSLLSIRFTIHALRLQREHNFKSLTPIAGIRIGNYENSLEVKIRNSGVGPLIVKRFFVADSSDSAKPEKNDLISCMPEAPDGIVYRDYTWTINGWCIGSNTELVLLQLEGDPDDEQFAQYRDAVRKVLSTLVVTLEYKDIYDRDMPSEYRHLGRFAEDFTPLDFRPTKKLT